MPCSMTGFVRQQQQYDWSRVIIEIRSVNCRYLDVSMRLPDELRIMEFELKKIIATKLYRGKVGVSIQLNQVDRKAEKINYNQEYAKVVATTLHDIDKLIYNAAPVKAIDVLAWPGVMDSSQTIISDEEKSDVISCFESALDNLLLARQQEGDTLVSLLLQRCGDILEIVCQVKNQLPDVLQQYRDTLTSKLEECKKQLDDIRLEQEILLFAQKLDISEELERIIAHIEEVKRILDNTMSQSGAQGRRLDFLMQELNREANTIGSKSVSIDSSQATVELKVLIEQMREQVQNIE
jgi:uncharacterized protein (TIGR00255 family)